MFVVFLWIPAFAGMTTEKQLTRWEEIMAIVNSIKPGNVVLLDKEFYKVIESMTHMGGGKSGAMIHMKLRNVSTGHVSERRFATDDKIEDVPVTRTKMQFLYAEGDSCTFMNPETYDQVPIPKNTIGPAAAFLKENDVIEVEFFEEKPLSVLHAPTEDLKVASTGAGLRGQTDSTGKEAVLENGMKILVPQFIKEGDLVRVDVETGKYLERINEREEKGAKFTTTSLKQKTETKEAPEKAPPAKSATNESKSVKKTTT